MKVTGIVILAILAALLAGACGSRTVPLSPASTPKLINHLDAKQTEWEKLVTAARKEGKVVVYTTIGTEARESINRAFKQSFGFEIEFILGRGAEIAVRILTEDKANLRIGDLFHSGPSTALNMLKPAGLLETMRPALILPEVIDPKIWYEGKLPFVEKDETIFAFVANPAPGLLINTEMVKPEDLQSHRDLLNPKWKGKIILDDPTTPGFGARYTFMLGELLGWDYLRELAKQEPLVLRDRRVQVDWIAHKKYPIGFGSLSDIVEEFMKAGAPIKYHHPTRDGWYINAGSGSITLLKGAPHPNAARLFLNWLFTREVQTIYVRGVWNQSARLDVPTDHLVPHRIRQPDKVYINADSEEMLIKSASQEKMIRDIFLPVMNR